MLRPPTLIVLIMVRWVRTMHGPRSRLMRMCTLGDWSSPISFLRRTRVAVYEGVYVQAHEFYGPGRREYNAPVRIAQREGCMRECTGGGAFAETIINTLFGYIPKLGQRLTLFEPRIPRGFAGELCHVQYGSDQFAIRSGSAGLHLRKEESTPGCDTDPPQTAF
jgi:hypothetical protein